jgi:hypothetical protein
MGEGTRDRTALPRLAALTQKEVAIRVARIIAIDLRELLL